MLSNVITPMMKILATRLTILTLLTIGLMPVSGNAQIDSPYKILVPEEARYIVSKVKMVPGFQDVEKQLLDKMNKAAEIAAKKATPIFVDAITALTIKDAMNILMGENDAATRYLETQTRTSLYTAFMPDIQAALDEVNAREYWKTSHSELLTC